MMRHAVALLALAGALIASPVRAADATTRPLAVVLIGGYGTDLSLATTQFSAVSAAIRERAPDSVIVQYSYAGTSFAGCEAQPLNYARSDTAQELAVSVRILRETLVGLQNACPVDRIAVVGHSLGGLIAFNALTDPPVSNVSDLVTLDSPLGGMPDRLVQACLDLDFCPDGPVAALLPDLFVHAPDNAARVGALSAAGIRVSAWGNENDCFYDVTLCAPFARALIGSVDARESQWLGMPDVVRKAYPVTRSLAAINASHTAILKNAAAELAAALLP